MLRKATQRLIPGLVEAASVSAPSRFATPCPAAMVTQRHVTARRAFSATTRTLQEEKKDEKPAEKAAGDAKAEGGSAAEEELRKQLVAKDKRIAELQVRFLSLRTLSYKGISWA